MLTARSRSFGRRGAILAALTAALGLAMVPAAEAHVRVLSYQPAVQGGYAALTFRVPTEENSPTVKLEVTLPTDTPLASVSTMPKAGWTVTLDKSAPKTPLKSDDGDVTEVVSRITWTATAGGIPVDGYDEFNISVGPLPTVASLSFPAVQTYGNGDVVRWIEPTPAGGAAPDHPVPTLALVTAAASITPAPSPTSTGVSVQNGVTTAGGDKGSDGIARGLGIGGLVLGALGLVLAGGCVLRLRRSA